MQYLQTILLCLLLTVPAFSAETLPMSRTTSQATGISRIVHGNVKSKIYHNASCKYFTCKACTAVFPTAADARTRGYRACKVCGG